MDALKLLRTMPDATAFMWSLDGIDPGGKVRTWMAKRDEFLSRNQDAKLIEAADRIVDETGYAWCGRCDEMVELPADLDAAIGVYKELRGHA